MKEILGLFLDREGESVVVYDSNDKSKKTKPLTPGPNIEEFASSLFQAGVGKKWIDSTKVPQSKFIEAFDAWYNGKETAAPLNLDILDEPAAPQAPPVAAPVIAAPPPLKAAPLIPVVPKPVSTLTEFAAPTPTKVVPQEVEKPKEVTPDWLKKKYKDIMGNTATSRPQALQQLAELSNIPASVLDGIIPPDTVPKPIPQPAAQPATPLPTPAQLPQPTPQVTVQQPTGAIDLPALTKGLSPTQLEWLKNLSILRKQPDKDLIIDYHTEAKKRPLPTHWTNIMFEDAMAREVIKGKKDKYKYALLWNSKGETIECFAKPDIKLELGKCYVFPEVNSMGRLIATTRAVGLDNFPEQNKPIISKADEVGDIASISQPWNAFQPIQLKQALDSIKYNSKPMIETVSGTIIDIIPWGSGNGCFVSINDGSDLPGLYSAKVSLNWDSEAIDVRNRPMSIEKLMALKGKYMLVFGVISYSPSNPQKNYPEGMMISPLYLVVSA